MTRRSKILPGHAFHSKTDSELRFIIDDAYKAQLAMRGHDAQAEAKYADQVNDACTILHSRLTPSQKAFRTSRGISF